MDSPDLRPLEMTLDVPRLGTSNGLGFYLGCLEGQSENTVEEDREGSGSVTPTLGRVHLPLF